MLRQRMGSRRQARLRRGHHDHYPEVDPRVWHDVEAFLGERMARGQRIERSVSARFDRIARLRTERGYVTIETKHFRFRDAPTYRPWQD